MINALIALLCCQLAGEALVLAAGLPIPGPVAGMALLFAGLVVKGGIPANIAALGDGLLGNLSLMFVPAGVGVMLHAPLMAAGLARDLRGARRIDAGNHRRHGADHAASRPEAGSMTVVDGGFKGIWVYLAASPLLHLTLTLVAYQCGLWLYRRAKLNPLVNPVLLAVLAIVAILVATGTPYQRYFEGAQFVHFLLGPATVALAIPLYRQLEQVRRSALALVVSILTGSLTAMLSAVLIARLLGATPATVVSLAPKSVTAPVAMGISQQLGGLPSLDGGARNPDGHPRRNARVRR